MKRTKTVSGLTLIKFEDIYGEECGLQKSSLASEDAVWLGPIAGARMHLDQALAEKLIAELQYFVETGELKPRKSK